MLKRFAVLAATVGLLSGSALLAVAAPAGATSAATSGSPQQDYVYGLFADYLTGAPSCFAPTWTFAPIGSGPTSLTYVGCSVFRMPDSTALSYFANQLGLATSTIPPSAASMNSVATQIIGSAEYRNDLVNWGYNCYLGRPGDATGVAYYDALKGVTANSLAVAMLSSNELFSDTVNSPYGPGSTYTGANSVFCGETQSQYYNNGAYNGTPPATSAPNGNFDTWLTDVYAVLLGRAVDSGAKTYWDAQYVKGVSPASIVTAILNSAEYETNQVSNIYTHLLRRSLVTTPDSAGIAYWVSQMKGGAGLTPEQVMAGVTATSEYWAYTQSANNV